MPPIFSEKERELILNELKTNALECLKDTGIKKTTVDQLTQLAGISKGAFYIFYNAKEDLFADILNDAANKIIREAQNGIQNPETKTSDLTGIFLNFFDKMADSLLAGLSKEDIDCLLKKMQKENLVFLAGFQNMFPAALFENFNLRRGMDIQGFLQAAGVVYSNIFNYDFYGATKDEFKRSQRFILDSLIKNTFE